jgi:hypothetical protein
MTIFDMAFSSKLKEDGVRYGNGAHLQQRGIGKHGGRRVAAH